MSYPQKFSLSPNTVTDDIFYTNHANRQAVLLTTETKATNITLYHSFADIAALWQAFESNCDNYAFQNFTWLKHWHENVGTLIPCQPCLVVVELAGSPIMILPLGIERRHGVACLVWLGGDVSDYHGPLLSQNYQSLCTADFFQTTWQDIKVKLPSFDAILFEKMPATLGTQANPFVTLPCIPTASNAHFTHFGTSFDDFLKKKRSSKSIATEKRKHRRLQEYGQVEFIIARDSTSINHVLHTMIAQKGRSYKEMGVANLFADEGICDFFNALSMQEAPNGMVHLSALKLNDRIIATHWGVVYKKRFYHLYPTYEQSELTKYAPGGLLMWNLFEWCITNGVEIYDFTIGDESYKDQWCDQELGLFDCYQGRTALGHCYAVLFKLALRLKRKIKHTPALWEIAQRARLVLSKLHH